MIFLNRKNNKKSLMYSTAYTVHKASSNFSILFGYKHLLSPQKQSQHYRVNIVSDNNSERCNKHSVIMGNDKLAVELISNTFDNLKS